MYFSGISLPKTIIRAVLLCFILQSCSEFGFAPDRQRDLNNYNPQDNFPTYTSYKDIPGVTQEEIAIIEGFRSSGRAFVYGAYLTSECFDDSGSMGGFGALFCQWLGDLFGVEFTPVIYEWTDLLAGLETGAIDFTGELTVTPERQKDYLMTSTIAQRTVIITELNGNPDPEAISTWRKPRFGYLTNSVTHSTIQPALPFEVEAIYVDSVDEAYSLLRAGKIDAFLEDGYIGATAIQNDLTITELIPAVYNPVSMSTRKAELAPIISIVQKYLNHGALFHLVDLYNQGYKDYFTYCFHTSLTEEEKAYVRAHDGSLGEIKPIPFIMEKDNYPWAFYDKTENNWQGIAWDVLKNIESICGLEFEVVSSKDDTWSENLAQLERGEGAFVSKLIRTSERKNKFLWTEAPYAKDHFALLSRKETPDVGINEILYSRVGLLANSAYTEYFPLWFPNHPNTVIYPTRAEALEALKKGEIDLYMGTRDTILNLTNYMEEPGYKVNLIFYQTVDSYFGFNTNEEILCSVINKAQALVNTEMLESRWLSRTFDYRTTLIRQRQPYLIGFSVALVVIVLLLVTLIQKYKDSKQHLKVLVRRRTRELEFQKNAAQTAYKVKNRFLANMSHEIRTPLNAIIGLSQAEMEKAGLDSKENLSSINHSGSLLLGIINDLLDISNIETGEMQLIDSDYSLPMFISSAAEYAKLQLGNKPVKLILETDENLPLKLHGDKQRVKQILCNLLSNAVKFTNDGSIIFRTRFENPDEENFKLIFEIIDTGIGIREKHMEKLFSDYSQADVESTRSAGGIGMGLIITKKLARMMKGDISASSEFGKGSTFTAVIPQKIIDKTVLGKEAVEKLRVFNWKETQGDRISLPYARVLVVDDVPTNHAVARGIMRPYKMTIDTVLSGEEAIVLIEKAEVHYDAIFMDHMMPGMDGIETTKRIRELGTDYSASIPIIALTANALPENEELFLSNGFNAYMTKPINVNVLNVLLNQWVRNEEKEKLFAAEQPQEEEEQIQSGLLSTYSIQGVDLAAGAAQFGGENNYLEIVKVFVNDTPKLLGDIQKFIDGFRIMPAAAAAALESLKNYTITVHGIKGSCYGICATPVGDLAKELEMAAKSQNLGRVLELNNEFIKATGKLVDELKVLFPQKEDSAKIEKPFPDRAVLQKLLDAAKSFNINTILDVLDELDQYRYQEDADLVSKLRETAENYEYNELINLLDNVVNNSENNSFNTGTNG